MNRVYPPAAKGHTSLLYDDLSWLQPDLNQLPELSRYDDSSVSWRLYQITELSEGKAAGRRLAMENVVASLRHSNSAFVYVLSGNASGIKLHIGVASDSDQAGGAAYHQYVELGPIRERVFHLVHTQSPRANTGTMPQGDTELHTQKLTFAGNVDGHKLFAKITGPASIEICTAASLEDVGKGQAENIKLIDLR